MAEATIPAPLFPGVPPIMWGANAALYPGGKFPASSDLRTLIGWGAAVPEPLQLNAIERIAVAYYDGWIECSDGSVISLYKAQKGADGRWGNYNGDGTWHGSAVCWASDPKLAVVGGPLAGSFVPQTASWGTLPYPTGLDPSQPDGVATAANIVGWGRAVQPSMRLNAVEGKALSGARAGNLGWVKVQGKNGAGVINLHDPRYEKRPDGTWQNRNHEDASGNLGLVVDVASRPSNGVAGFIDAIEHDVTSNPLGALLFVLVAVSGAALLPVLLGLAQPVAVGAVATGHGHDALAGAAWVAKHPAEVGTAIAAAELVVAGAAIGSKGLSRTGTDLLGHSLSPPDPTGGYTPPSGSDLTSSAGQAQRDSKHWWDVFR